MRRLLVAGMVAVVFAGAAACGSDDDEGGEDQPSAPPAGNTAVVCEEAAQSQSQMQQQFEAELTRLDEEDLDDEAYEEQVVQALQELFTGSAEGLRGPASRAEDPELAEALTNLADVLAEVAPQLTMDSLQGDVPEAQRLDEHGATLSTLCGMNSTPPPTSTPTSSPTS